MKKAFHNIFGGKKEKEKDKEKNLERPEDGLLYGSALSLDSGTNALRVPPGASSSKLSSNPSFSEGSRKLQLREANDRRHLKREKLAQERLGSSSDLTESASMECGDNRVKRKDSIKEPSSPSTPASDASDQSSQKLPQPVKQQQQQQQGRRRDSRKHHQQLQQAQQQLIQHPRYLLQPFDSAVEAGGGRCEGGSRSQNREKPAADERHSQQKISALQRRILELESSLQTYRESPAQHEHKSTTLPTYTSSSNVSTCDLPDLPPGSDLQQMSADDANHTLVPGPSKSAALMSKGACSVCGCDRLTSSSHQLAPLTSPHGDDVTVTSPAVITATAEVQTDHDSDGVSPTSDTSVTTVDNETQTEPVSDTANIDSADLSSEIARLTSLQQQLSSRTSLIPLSPPGGSMSLMSVALQTDAQVSAPAKEDEEVMHEMRKKMDALEEQRNELEEAENDARHMVQRLEVKLHTAAEVERMLSTELSESRDSCSQLQRQLTAAKLRHQTELRAKQADCSSAQERVRELEGVVEEVRTQLRESGHRRTEELRRSHDRESGQTEDMRRSEGSSPLLCEKSSTFSDSGVGEEMMRASDAATPSDHGTPASPVSPTRLTITYPGPNDASNAVACDPPTPVVCSVCSGEIVDASMTAIAGNSLEFILDNPWTTRSDNEAAKDFGRLVKSAEDDDDVYDQLKSVLQQQMNAFEGERAQLVSQHRSEIKSLQEERSDLQTRLKTSETTLTSLKEELLLSAEELQISDSDVTITTVTTTASLPSDLAGGPGPLSHTALLQRVRNTRRSEQRLISQVADLEKKDAAYRETLEEADRIMQAVEQRHARATEELEHQLREAKNRINFMEGTEEKLKAALYGASGKREQQKVAELLDKLIETETEDLKLKEKVYRLERREREQSIKLREEERASERLRLELSDQEELLRELDAARRELSSAREHATAVASLRQRTSELQTSETKLRERCEELEQQEVSLQEQLSRAQLESAHRERRLSEQLELRQHEADSLQAQLVELQLQQVADTELVSELRRELLQVQRRLTEQGGADAHATQEDEALLRQLGQLTRQLAEKDSQVVDLRHQLQQLQVDHDELQRSTDADRARAEQELAQMNLTLSRREEEAALMTSQLQTLTSQQHKQLTNTAELDTLAEQESTLMRLLSLVRAVENHHATCSCCRAASAGVLRSLSEALEQLLQLISGTAGADRSLQEQLRDAEAIAAAAERLAKPEGISVLSQTDEDSRIVEQTERAAHLEKELELSRKQLSAAEEQLEHLTRDRERAESEGKTKVKEERKMSEARERDKKISRIADIREELQERRVSVADIIRDREANTTDRESCQTKRHLANVEPQNSRTLSERDLQGRGTPSELQGRTTPAERDPHESLSERSITGRATPSDDGTSSSEHGGGSSSKVSRIPRRMSRNPDLPSVPSQSRKATPPSRVPLPRRTQSVRDASGSTPPVGVARPYRSQLTPLAPGGTSSRSHLRQMASSLPTALARDTSPLNRETSPLHRERESSPALRDSAFTLREHSKLREPSPLARNASAVFRDSSIALREPVSSAPLRRDASCPSVVAAAPSIAPTLALPMLSAPQQFQIMRAVGGDSLLLYWSPVDDSRITGYQIYVNDELQLQIRNPQRTKALLPGMDLTSTMVLSIRAVAGDLSSPLSTTEYRPADKLAA